MFLSPLNGYPKRVVLQVLNKVERDLSTTSSTKNQQPDTHTHTHTHTHTFACPPIQRNTRWTNAKTY